MALPNIFPNLEYGGPIASSQRGLNALSQSRFDTEMKRLKALYAPITIPAQAASQMAYAQLVGPQFLAKFMANPEILANMSDSQKAFVRDLIVNSGTGAATGNAMIQPPPNQSTGGGQSNLSGGGLLTRAVNNAVNYLTGGRSSPNQRQQPAQPTNAFAQGGGGYPNFGASNRAPESVVNRAANLPPNTPPTRPEATLGEQVVEQNQQKTASAPQQPETGMIQVPPASMFGQPEPGKSWAETSAEFKGTEAEGTEAGKIRANDIKEFGDSFLASLDIGDSLNELARISNSPVWQNMRAKVPLFQSTQLSVLKKVGTPEQQDMIGDYVNSANEVVKKTVNQFKGQRMKGELTIAQNMKISDDDTFNVMVGKLRAAMMYNELNKRRSKLAAGIMEKYHLSKIKALELADKDKSVNGEQVRKEINNLLPKQGLEKQWPVNKPAKNEKALAEKTLPADSLWMIRPDGIKVPVHKSNEKTAIEKYKFRPAEYNVRAEVQ